MSNKIESLVILYGVGFAILAIAIYLIAKAKASRKEKAEVKNLETISAIKGGESIQYPSSTTIKLQGSLKSSKQTQESAMKVANNSTYGAYGSTGSPGPSGMTSTPYANSEKVKSKRVRKEPVFDNYVTDEDAGLVRKATSDGDFLTSMLVAEVTDSALLGTIVGGDPLGAMVGDMLNHDDDHSSTDFNDSPSHDDSWDTTDSTDYSSDNDWSSSDSSDWSSSDSSSSDW